MGLAVAEREAPTLSVVIPVYNAEPYLDECLSSALESSFEDLEVICVNDGSTDGSPEILESFARKDPRVSVIHQENQGVGMARNAGIRAARGAFIHLLDADDWVARDAYGPWCALASRHNADICECLYEYVDAATRKTLLVPTDWGIPEGEDELVTNVRKDPRLLIPGHVAGWNKLYSRAFLLSNDIWFEDLPCAEDRAFYYQALLRAQTYVRGSERWVFHRMNNPNSLDGGELRLRNFEVEFRSFESIWAMAQNESPELRIRLLDSCIGDTIFYFNRTKDTVFERAVAVQLCTYWRPYLPILGDAIFGRPWFDGLVRAVAICQPNAYRDLILGLGTRYREAMQRLEANHLDK